MHRGLPLFLFWLEPVCAVVWREYRQLCVDVKLISFLEEYFNLLSFFIFCFFWSSLSGSFTGFSHRLPWLLSLTRKITDCSWSQQSTQDKKTALLTNGYEPHHCYLGHGFGPGLILAVLNGFLDGYVAVQWDGTQVHDGRCGEQDVQEEPDWTEKLRKRPPGIWEMDRWWEALDC